MKSTTATAAPEADDDDEEPDFSGRPADVRTDTRNYETEEFENLDRDTQFQVEQEVRGKSVDDINQMWHDGHISFSTLQLLMNAKQYQAAMANDDRKESAQQFKQRLKQMRPIEMAAMPQESEEGNAADLYQKRSAQISQLANLHRDLNKFGLSPAEKGEKQKQILELITDLGPVLAEFLNGLATNMNYVEDTGRKRVFDGNYSRIEHATNQGRKVFMQEIVEEYREFAEDPENQVEIAMDPDFGEYVLFKDIQDELANGEVQQQPRYMIGTNLMITYVLHHRASDEDFNKYVMTKMSLAANALFNDPEQLNNCIDFGKRLTKQGDGSYKVSLIEALRPDSNPNNFPNSYPKDTFRSHMYYTETHGSIEIAPTTGFFHFHVILKMAHFSKLMFNYKNMEYWFEAALKGQSFGGKFRIDDRDGTLFFKDTDVPHTDVRLLPQDDWEKTINMYVTKTVVDYNDPNNNAPFSSIDGTT